MYDLRYVNMYLTWMCNHRCIHCWVEGSPEFSESLDKETAIDFLSKALPLGLKNMKITGGEPLLFEETVSAIIDFCKKNNIDVTMETNGTLLSDKFVNDYLIDNKINISISLNGYDRESHDNFVLYKGSFDVVLSNIKKLSELGVSYQIITSIYEDNVNDLEKVIELCSKYKPSIIKINPIRSIGRGSELNETKAVDFSTLRELANQTDKYAEKYGVKVFFHGPPVVRSFSALKCYSANSCNYLNMLSILPDKSIALCGYGGVNKDIIWDTYNLNYDLEYFWLNSKELETLRKMNEINGVCKECVHGKVCKGDCKAIAFNYYGKWDAPSPNCQNLYDTGKFPKSRLLK